VDPELKEQIERLNRNLEALRKVAPDIAMALMALADATNKARPVLFQLMQLVGFSLKNAGSGKTAKMWVDAVGDIVKDAIKNRKKR
jgi:hypothetical protein